MACPYDAIIWQEENRVVGKCHLCWHRLDQGKEPACVATCFGKALQTATEEELAARKDLVEENVCFKPHPDVPPNIRFIKKGEAEMEEEKG
jgi:Fe-S-cluster-containing dehydrogenase component